MTEVVLDDRLLVAILGAIATLGIALGANRREIARIQDRLWGPERASDRGIEDAVASLEADRRRIEVDVESLRRRVDRLEADRASSESRCSTGRQPSNGSRNTEPNPLRFSPGKFD